MKSTNVATGIFLGILAGILLGSFALPMKKVKIWQWEHSWVMFSFWATIVLPLLMAFLTIPNLFEVFTQTPRALILAVFLFGAGWGVANVGYGIGLKMVGLAMGTAIVLGLNNAIGAILPIFLYTPEKLLQPAGLALSAAVLVMISGIVVDLSKEDLDEYMERMSPKNNFLWIATESEEEEMAIMKNVEKWSKS